MSKYSWLNSDDTSGLDSDTYLEYDNDIGLMNSKEVEEYLDEFYGVEKDDLLED